MIKFLRGALTIREDLFTTLSPSHAVLLLFPCFRGCELRLLLAGLDLVAPFRKVSNA